MGVSLFNWARNPSIYNILRWVAWTMGQMNHRPRVWCSKYYFFILCIDLGHWKLFFYFCNFFKKIRKQIERIFANNFARNHEKKIILGRSDAWSTIHLSHRPSNPAKCIEDWRIFNPEHDSLAISCFHSKERKCTVCRTIT